MAHTDKTPDTTEIAASLTRRGNDRPAKLRDQADRAVRKAVAAELQEILDGRWADVKNETRALIAEKNLYPDDTLSMDEARERTLSQMSDMLETGAPRGTFHKDHGGTGDLGATLTAIEAVGGADLSLMVKA
ncbi:MAG: acyl-CoA oxidase, partial [Corynebacterium glyciniphilum]|nr:acyl-CoA oxidase [Corynebacterium glyciniphilum]